MEDRVTSEPSDLLRSQSPTLSETSVSLGRTTNFSSAQRLHLHSQGNGMPSYSSRPSLAAGMRLPNPPTFVEWHGLRFLIMDAPSESNLDLYLKELKRYNVTDLVRVCDPTYSRETVERQGIRLHELLFPDGDGPPDNIIAAWMSIVEARFGRKTHPREDHNSEKDNPVETIAVHCVAGLGRAPVLVAIALIEAGMSPLDAVTFLRERRRGAINNKQLRLLETYRRRFRFSSSCGDASHNSSSSVVSPSKCFMM